MRAPAARGKRDANHAAIADLFRSLGCYVQDTSVVGWGYPDITLGIAGETHLVEIKTEGGILNAAQKRFIRDWRGSKVHLVTNATEAIALVSAVRKRQYRQFYELKGMDDENGNKAASEFIHDSTR